MEIFHRLASMQRKKGDLPGRYVPPYIRKAPNQPSDYVNVSDYQERVEPEPSPLEFIPLQGELDLPVSPKPTPEE
jgi:hypothetical protein